MTIDFDPPTKLSWRDPSGFVVKKDNRIFRAVSTHKVPEVEALIASTWYQEGVENGTFPSSTWLDGQSAPVIDTAQFGWLEHRAIAFPCYPHEITALQLYDAGKLTLAIARTALANGWIIKDASAWNILFEDGKPRFCDILSFERVDNTGIWIAYAQFFRHFLIPLLLYRHTGLQTSALFVLHRDGVAPEQAGRMISGWRRFVQPTLEAITLPLMFGAKRQASAGGEAPVERSAELAEFLLARTLARLEKHLDALKPCATAKATKWENYEADRDHYSAPDVTNKSDFVAAMMQRSDIGTVLDLGCNAGEFSKIAATAGKTVVAADFDHGALSRLYQELRHKALPISPILLDIGRPTPAVGWLNREVDSFMARAKHKFDCVMALGLVHHLLVSERATLAMILEFFVEIDPAYLLLEWIEPVDRRFSEIAGINDFLYSEMSLERFELVFAEKYDIESKLLLTSGTRTLYFLKRKT